MADDYCRRPRPRRYAKTSDAETTTLTGHRYRTVALGSVTARRISWSRCAAATDSRCCAALVIAWSRWVATIDAADEDKVANASAKSQSPSRSETSLIEVVTIAPKATETMRVNVAPLKAAITPDSGRTHDSQRAGAFTAIAADADASASVTVGSDQNLVPICVATGIARAITMVSQHRASRDRSPSTAVVAPMSTYRHPGSLA
ncbi:hypothetical protein [Cellulomonas iranensis]|uniref:hypothetical protein n=1 Tax=Cellulomonas iranensis TaxID=76862 RepID=UPI001177783F|nr:hypothetical protein [Cellulomonas iranensis]